MDIFSIAINATVANPTFWKEISQLLAAAVIMKPLLTKAIEHGIEKVAANVTKTLQEQAEQNARNFAAQTEAMKNQAEQNDRNFAAQNKQISFLHKQYNEMVRQFRYLKTRDQIDIQEDLEFLEEELIESRKQSEEDKNENNY